MNTVYRISASTRSIHIECWPDWYAFGAQGHTRLAAPANIAVAVGDVDFSHDCALYELQRWRVNNGAGASAKALLQEDQLAWKRLGAQSIGVFEIVHGDDLPAIIVILGWLNIEEAATAQSSFNADKSQIDRRRSQHAEDRQIAIRGGSRLLAYQLSLEAF